MSTPLVIGIVGTGFISTGLVWALERTTDLRIGRVLTRRSAGGAKDFPAADRLTDSINELIDTCDLIVECSGDVLHAARVVDAALAAGRPVVTMNAEFHVTIGSAFAGRGVLTEAHGDQPGALAALHEQAIAQGFTPLVYGNRKGFSNLNPSLADMQHWAAKQGISLEQVTAATDGTKLQIEQALVANGLGADIACEGLLGPSVETLPEGGHILAAKARDLGRPIADYVLAPKAPAGVFIAATHDPRQAPALEYFKLGPGPVYTLVHNYHLCHLEIPQTIRRVHEARERGRPMEGVLLDNSANPRIGVAALAKRRLEPGTHIARAIGSFDMRGIAVRLSDHPRLLPIGLIADAVMTRTVDPGAMLTWDDVELPDSLAVELHRSALKARGMPAADHGRATLSSP